MILKAYEMSQRTLLYFLLTEFHIFRFYYLINDKEIQEFYGDACH